MNHTALIAQEGLTLTTSTIPPTEDHVLLGLVTGSAVISRSIVRDLGAALKNTTGGELRTYTSLLDHAAATALERLSRKASSAGADGVFGILMGCPQVAGGAAEVIFMGTAYKLRS